MPAISVLTLADGQATPVNKTFDVQQGQVGDNSPAAWLEKSAGSYTGYKRLTVAVKRSQAGRSTKVQVKLVDPNLAVTAPASGTGIQPVPTVSYSCLATIEFVLPDACTVQNRKDILAYAKNLLANAAMTSAVVDLSPAY